MTLFFALVLLAGLAVGVTAMIGGIDRKQRHGAWVKYLNLPTAGAAAAMFGIVGYPLAKYSSLGTAAKLAIAGGAAAAAAVGMVALIAGWAVPSAALHVEDPRYALQGHFARVLQPISAGRAGEIAFEHDGERHTAPALGLDGAAIDSGAEVVIERIEDGIAYVELWSNIEKQLEIPG
jgi:membrane protein implicated in regulation of membrane protease activity